MIKLITFNIKCGGKDIYSIDHRAPLLKTVLDKYDADIIGFQEATPNWMEHIEEDYGAEYEIFNKYRSRNNFESTPILWRKSRFDCLDKGYFWLSDTPDIDAECWDTWGCNRICMWVKLYDKQEGKTMTFFNTHYGFGDENQIKSGNLILSHFKAMKVDCGFLTADFNMTYTRPGYKLLEQHFIDANMATVKDLRLTCHGYNPNRTGGAPIDICFVTPETVVPLTAKRIDDLVNGEFPSDHYGFYFELEVRQPVKLLSLNAGPTSVRSRLTRKDVEFAALQGQNAEVAARLAESFKMVAQNEGTVTPIVWKEGLYDLVEEVTSDKMAIAVLKKPVSGQKFCVINAELSEDEAEQMTEVKEILEKAAEYAELPTLLTGTFRFRIGSPAYCLVREQFEDLRHVAAPQDFTPTYSGMAEDMKEPCICNYTFIRKVKALKYEVAVSKNRRGYYNEYNGIEAAVILED